MSFTLELESILNDITQLTGEWYQLIGSDHHKDKDCHFYISTVWSYGASAYYRPEHWGYVHDGIDWDLEFPEYRPVGFGNVFRGFTTYRAAAEWLRNRLATMIDIEKRSQQENE